MNCIYLNRNPPTYPGTHPQVHEENTVGTIIVWYLGVQITANSKFQHINKRGDGCAGTNPAIGNGKDPVSDGRTGICKLP
jgi:hypothetical protein